ncbi:sugar ABC transporter permease [Azospirillum sp.]|uniref:carbohydrate ABC transporter permease n=1 Tax=Azospirillum sp. TaxID=34012 RepID=UPI00262F83C8|nr:sugar ABC transporter permease [Azospirillum sp.]
MTNPARPPQPAATGANTSRRANRRAVALMLAPALLLLALFLVLPFLLSIGLSVTNYNLLNRRVVTLFVGLANYASILEDERFWRAAWNTARFALVTVPVQSALALLLAVLVNSGLPGRNLFRGVYFLPTVLSMAVVSVIWAGLLRAPQGVLNALVGALSGGALSGGALGPYDWLGDETLAMPTIIVLSVWQGVGFQMVIYLAGLQSINAELYEAARIDGASRFQQFLHITLPSLRNTHVFVVLATTVLAFKLFGQVDVLTQGGPLDSTNTLVRYLFNSGFREHRVGYASAASVLFFLLVLGITLVQRALVREDREI